MRGPLFEKLLKAKGMKNLLIPVEEVIDEEDSPDVWIVYESDPFVNQYYSLQQSLWQVSFDPLQDVKTYQIEHSDFFKILQ